MKKLLIVMIVVGASVFLSGCGGSGGDLFSQALKSNTPVKEEVISNAPVKTMTIEGYGEVLVTKGSMPLYTKSGDTSSSSTCYDECAIAWPPLTVDYADEVSGDYGVLERTNGVLQVTRLGKPLYSYVPDKTRKVTGDGYRGIWSVVIVEE